jgi:glycerol-3-phosphate dehydrogenase
VRLPDEPNEQDLEMGEMADDGHVVGCGGELREDRIRRVIRIETGPLGMVTVTGGKLTTFRQMASEVVDRVFHQLAAEPVTAPTEVEPLVGGEAPSWDSFRQSGLDLGLPDTTMDHLISHFGTETAAIVNLVRNDRTLMARIHPEHPAVAAEVLQVVRRELAVTVEDVLARRLHLTTETADRGVAAAHRVAQLMGQELGWNPEQIAAESALFMDRVSRETRLD